MKTIVLILMMLSVFTVSNAQLKGVPFDQAISMKQAEDYTDDELYNVLIKMEDDSATVYTYVYELKSKGYYDALKQLSRILDANNISRSADIDDSYFRPHVDEKDYNNVVYELKMEKGWIERSWFVYDNTWRITMMASDDGILIFIAHYK